MTGFGDGFTSGVRTGAGLVRSYKDMRRQEALQAREDEQWQWQQEDRTREAAQRKRVDDAWAGYDNLNSGVGPEAGAALRQTYGMSAGQVQAAAAQPGGLKAKLAAYDVPDSHELQNVPAAPRVNAENVGLRTPTELDRERAMGHIAAASRDPKGMRESQANERTLAQRDVYNAVMKMSDDEIAKMAPMLNTNNSQVPLLYVGKGKGGYTFLSMDAEGNPGNQFKMSPAQMRQLVVATKLGEAGFGAEGLELASKTHAAVGEAVKSWNATLEKSTTTNNQATRYANSDANDNARTGIAARSAARADARAARQDLTPYAFNEATNSIEFYDKRTGKTVSQKVPQGVDGAGLFRKITGQGPQGGVKVHANGLVESGGQLYSQGADGNFAAVKGIGPSQLDLAIAEDLKRAGQDGAPRGGLQREPQGGGLNEPPVPGRPMYYADQVDLERAVKKPRGTSQAEANAAREELRMRQGESRIKALN